MDSKNNVSLGELDAMLSELNDVVYKHVGRNTESKVTLKTFSDTKLVIQAGSELELTFIVEKKTMGNTI